MTEFRDATEADLPAIVRLLADDVHGQGREQPTDPLPACYATAFHAMQAQGGRIMLAVQDGTVVGCLQLNVLHNVSHMGRTRAQVEGVRVAQARRGSGVGAALMEAAIAEARRAGCGLVQLTTQLQREDAQRFYRRLGFVGSHLGMKLTLG